MLTYYRCIQKINSSTSVSILQELEETLSIYESAWNTACAMPEGKERENLAQLIWNELWDFYTDEEVLFNGVINGEKHEGRIQRAVKNASDLEDLNRIVERLRDLFAKVDKEISSEGVGKK